MGVASFFSFFPLAFLPKCLLLEVRTSKHGSGKPVAWECNFFFLERMVNQLWNDVNNWTGSFLLYFQLLQKGTVTRCVVEKAKVQQQTRVPALGAGPGGGAGAAPLPGRGTGGALRGHWKTRVTIHRSMTRQRHVTNTHVT